MNLLYSRIPFVLLLILGFITFIASLVDILLSDIEFLQATLAVYGIIVFLGIALVIYQQMKQSSEPYKNSVTQFEKSLKGRLHHYKCPNCSGVFAIKKSKRNNKKEMKLTCPDCGAVGVIPPEPDIIRDIIPAKKSSSIRLKCDNCKEWVTIWAEGQDIHNHITIFTCPYCEAQKPLYRF